MVLAWFEKKLKTRMVLGEVKLVSTYFLPSFFEEDLAVNILTLK
jgi:hypothetical protein